MDMVMDMDKGMDVGPAPSPEKRPQIHLTLNQLVFHKVLGKGSFGKVRPCNTWANVSKTVTLNSVVGAKVCCKTITKSSWEGKKRLQFFGGNKESPFVSRS